VHPATQNLDLRRVISVEGRERGREGGWIGGRAGEREGREKRPRPRVKQEVYGAPYHFRDEFDRDFIRGGEKGEGGVGLVRE